jgi:uncharacterized DUF497 family protein
MTKWHRFIPSRFEYDFVRDELAEHSITFEEAVECFYNDFEVRKNKDYSDRFKLLGKTDGGRTLCIIFLLKDNNVVRIITGWDI